MVKIVKIISFILFFVLALIYFTPKASLYYKAEQELQKYKVVLANEEVKDKVLCLQVEHATVYFNAIESAKVEWMELKFLVAYNSVKLKNIELSSVVASFIPTHIDAVQIKYTVLNPLNVLIEANGEFGTFKAKLNLKSRKILGIMQPSKKMLQEYRNTLREFHKNSVGEYVYEKTL